MGFSYPVAVRVVNAHVVLKRGGNELFLASSVEDVYQHVQARSVFQKLDAISHMLAQCLYESQILALVAVLKLAKVAVTMPFTQEAGKDRLRQPWHGRVCLIEGFVPALEHGFGEYEVVDPQGGRYRLRESSHVDDALGIHRMQRRQGALVIAEFAAVIIFENVAVYSLGPIYEALTPFELHDARGGKLARGCDVDEPGLACLELVEEGVSPFNDVAVLDGEAGVLHHLAHCIVAGILHGDLVRFGVEEHEQVLEACLRAALDDHLLGFAAEPARHGEAPGYFSPQRRLSQGVSVGVDGLDAHGHQDVVGESSPGKRGEGSRLQVAVGEVIACFALGRFEAFTALGVRWLVGAGVQEGDVLDDVARTRSAGHIPFLYEHLVGRLNGVTRAAKLFGEAANAGQLAAHGVEPLLDALVEVLVYLLVIGEGRAFVEVHG